jgi:hypothetical protein
MNIESSFAIVIMAVIATFAGTPDATSGSITDSRIVVKTILVTTGFD